MYVEEIQAYCAGKPGTTVSLKFENLLCCCIGEKIYAAVHIGDIPHALIVKVDPDTFDDYVADPLYVQAAYFAKRQWINCTDIALINPTDAYKMIDISYQLIFQKLTKKLQQSIIHASYHR